MRKHAGPAAAPAWLPEDIVDDTCMIASICPGGSGGGGEEGCIQPAGSVLDVAMRPRSAHEGEKLMETDVGVTTSVDWRVGEVVSQRAEVP